jgi:hypothetical protein
MGLRMRMNSECLLVECLAIEETGTLFNLTRKRFCVQASTACRRTSSAIWALVES